MCRAMSMSTSACMYVYVYVCVYTCVSVCIYVCMFVCVRVYSCDVMSCNVRET